MTISSAAVSQFKSLIWYHLDHDLLETATFFAERLHAYATLDEETQYLLAKCLFRRKQYNSAYHYLRNSSSFSCKFMLARCCIYLEKLEEAEKLLLSLLTEENIQYEDVNLDKIDHRNRFNCPDKSVVYLNLGLVYRKLERQADAEKQFSKCVELNPFHWAAFENICYIKNGTAMNVNTYFDLNRASQIANSDNIEKKISNPDIIKLPEQIGTKVREDRVFTKPKIPPTRGVSRNPLQCSLTLAQSNKVLPRVVSTESNVRRPTLQRTIPARTRGELSSNIPKKGSSIIKTVPSRVIKSAGSVVETELGARRMARVTTIATNPPAPSAKPRQISKPSKIENISFTNAYRGTSALHAAQRVKRTRIENENSIDKVDVDKKIKVETALSFKDDTNKSSNALSSSVLNHQILAKRKGTEIVIDLLRKIGQSLVYLQNYKCAQALETFSSLPTSQFNTGWVLSRVGKAYFELAKYKEAEDKFEQMRLVEPYRLDGLEIYSTTLWHLQKEVNLSHLGHELMDIDRESPQSWFAIGNCYSLRREHQSAIRCFMRAIQLDPNMAYGHTLCGHEYISAEDYDNAMNHFRSALRLDPNHYNAWYGMGTVALKTDKIPTAKYYFSKAVGINPTNNVLLCCIGTVLEKSDKLPEALRWYQAAQKYNPESPLPKLKIAKTLMALKRYEEALPLFQYLKEIYPQEASIRYLVGQTFKKLGNTSDALMEFTKALDMDCKNSNVIRNAIDNLPLTEIDVASSHEEGMIKVF